MCILAPFTLPCCRQIYVSVSRTTQCPQDWPSSKCASEICIQIHQYEPEHRSTGICWRCQADKEGEIGSVREKRRPAIDKARVAAGLEPSESPVSPKKRSRTNTGSRSGNKPNKKIKLEAQDDKISSLRSHRSQHNGYQLFGTDFQLCPTTSGPSRSAFGDNLSIPFYGDYEPQDFSPDMPETVPNNWHDVNQQRGGGSHYNDFPNRNVQDHQHHGVERGNTFGYKSPMQVAQKSSSPVIRFAAAMENNLDPVSELQPVFVTY